MIQRKGTMKRAKHITLAEIQATSEKINGKRLTDKQAIFVQEKLKGKSGTQSAFSAYNTDLVTAATIAKENTRKPQIQNTFQQLMEDKGITDSYLIEKVRKGIEEGNIEGKQINYLELALKIKGKLQSVNVNLSHTIKETRKGYELE